MAEVQPLPAEGDEQPAGEHFDIGAKLSRAMRRGDIMLALAEGISTFVSKNPTVKTLALAFLLLIGVMLTAEGVHFHIEKGYIYFAMGFSIFVELINRQVRKRGRRMNPWRRPGPPPM